MRSRMVMGRAAGTESSTVSPAWSITATRMSANFGKYIAKGSSIVSRPCSTSFRAPTATMGLVIDAMLKIVSAVIATPAALSR